MIPGTNELHTRAEPTWRRLGPQFLNSLKSVGSLLVPFHLSPILFSVENMDTLHWSFPYAQKEASSLPLTSSGVHTPRQRSYKISNWSYIPPWIQQKKNSPESTGWFCPSASFKTPMAQWACPTIKTGILNKNSPWICPTSRQAEGLSASGHSSFSNNHTIPVSDKTAEKFAFSEQPECSHSCWVCSCVPKHIT